MVRKLLAIALIAFALPAVTNAQASTGKNILSIQPLNWVFGFYSAEFEREASGSVTWGLGANYWNGFNNDDDDYDHHYSSTEFKLRFYPDGTPLRGFSFGGAIGFTRIQETYSSGTDVTESGPSLAMLLEYQWLRGARENIAVAVGLGAKTIFVDRSSAASDYTAKYPTLRISVGYRF